MKRISKLMKILMVGAVALTAVSPAMAKMSKAEKINTILLNTPAVFIRTSDSFNDPNVYTSTDEFGTAFRIDGKPVFINLVAKNFTGEFKPYITTIKGSSGSVFQFAGHARQLLKGKVIINVSGGGSASFDIQKTSTNKKLLLVHDKINYEISVEYEVKSDMDEILHPVYFPTNSNELKPKAILVAITGIKRIGGSTSGSSSKSGGSSGSASSAPFDASAKIAYYVQLQGTPNSDTFTAVNDNGSPFIIAGYPLQLNIKGLTDCQKIKNKINLEYTAPKFKFVGVTDKGTKTITLVVNGESQGIQISEVYSNAATPRVDFNYKGENYIIKLRIENQKLKFTNKLFSTANPRAYLIKVTDVIAPAPKAAPKPVETREERIKRELRMFN